jgi:hypothetical protein
MKKIIEVIREMRELEEMEVPRIDLGAVTIYRWRTTLEAAMREPVAEIEPINRLDGSIVTYCRYDRTELPPGTKLYAMPPDAAAEIRYLRSRLAVLFQTATDAEIERLQDALHQISLCSQNVMGSKEECGRIAHAALAKEDKP